MDFLVHFNASINVRILKSHRKPNVLIPNGGEKGKKRGRTEWVTWLETRKSEH